MSIVVIASSRSLHDSRTVTTYLGIEVYLLEYAVNEPAELVVILGRETEHPGDHRGRDVLRILRRRVDHRPARLDLAEVEEYRDIDASDRDPRACALTPDRGERLSRGRRAARAAERPR